MEVFKILVDQSEKWAIELMFSRSDEMKKTEHNSSKNCVKTLLSVPETLVIAVVFPRNAGKGRYFSTIHQYTSLFSTV